MNPSRLDSRGARGFTLVELLLTALVIATAFVAATWSMTAVARTRSVYEEGSNPAFFLASEIQALAAGLPRAPSGSTGATSGTAVLALDSLAGANFSPPILADCSVASGFSGWSQVVGLSAFALDDLSTPIAGQVASGLPPESAALYRLDVSVLKQGELIDSFSWWIHP